MDTKLTQNITNKYIISNKRSDTKKTRKYLPVDEFGYICADNLNEKIIPKKCCSLEFELEDKYLELLALTHFYERLKSYLECANIGRERNLQCPRGCDSLFENYHQLVLHFGVFQHAKLCIIIPPNPKTHPHCCCV